MTWNAMLMAMSVVAANPRLAAGKEDAEELSSVDLDEIRSVIGRQIAAFRSRDGQAAWGLCSEEIRQTFETPEALLRTVRERYAPLLTADVLRFGEIMITPVGLGVVCEVVDGEGAVAHAVYIVCRQEDGFWAVNGCILIGGEVDVSALAA